MSVQLYFELPGLLMMEGKGEEGAVVKEAVDTQISAITETLVSPEPASFLLLVLGVLGVYCARKLFK